MTNLTNRYDNSKLTATARHLHGQIARLKEIRNQKTNRTIMLQEGSTKWPLQFGQFAGSLVSLKPRYHLENIQLDQDRGLLHVEFCLQHEWDELGPCYEGIDDIAWTEESISLVKLRDFAVDRKMNQYCKDWADHRGEHQQETGAIDIAELMDQYDFLQEVAKEYLEAGKEVEL